MSLFGGLTVWQDNFKEQLWSHGLPSIIATGDLETRLKGEVTERRLLK